MADFERLVAAIGRLEAMTETNSGKSEILRGILVSRMDIHEART
jgi:hypothetical protein